MRVSIVVILAQAVAAFVDLEKQCNGKVETLYDGNFCDPSRTPYCCRNNNDKYNNFPNPRTCVNMQDSNTDWVWPDCDNKGSVYCC
ncbi:hypothetical protein QTJ16_003637 [Diplocarpon rosae]|uniref:Uncharacterized protein n=1 Tax=Diplocarpon rosae TaxID=946125 RepID=A0AAD9WCH0_9HELO|nr:hypothetical protein QTJ16_003637 [Diplocarpon rosae]